MDFDIGCSKGIGPEGSGDNKTQLEKLGKNFTRALFEGSDFEAQEAAVDFKDALSHFGDEGALENFVNSKVYKDVVEGKREPIVD